MKKPKRRKKIRLPKLSIRSFKFWRKQTIEERFSDALSNVPRITNETVEDHREVVLARARKYIYPLKQSKHHIVRTSVSIFIGIVVAFLVVCGLLLYVFQNTSTFIYDITEVVPFPVAKVGNDWVSYSFYLFELRHDVHFYKTQEHVDFSSPSGRTQLAHLKQQAMATVIQDTEVKQLAAKHDVSVSNHEVNQQIALVRAENRLGSSQDVFNAVLSEVYGWNENDFRQELKRQLLQQEVVTRLDTAAVAKAQTALAEINKGTSFATVASQVSDDTSTKGNGGQYPGPITLNDSNLSPIITAELFKLKPGQVSGIVNTGYTLEILKSISSGPGGVIGAHIQINLQNIDTYLKPLQANERVEKYIKV